MMKRVLSALLFTVILLSACSQQAAPTWQEQYDLGVRYLSEGNYQEAIIAFTAAIEIDPKRAPAYVGRGDSYLLSGESEENLNAAREDYKQAISLDKLAADVYGKLADVYMALGDLDGAMAILQQGYDATGDEALLGRLEELQEDKPAGASETVVIEGYFIHNPDVYRESWDPYISQYQQDNVRCSIDTYGIRFIQPVDVTVAGEAATISEACAVGLSNLFDNSQLHDYDTDSNGPMIDHPLRITGYFYLNEQTTELRKLGFSYAASDYLADFGEVVVFCDLYGAGIVTNDSLNAWDTIAMEFVPGTGGSVERLRAEFRFEGGALYNVSYTTY